MQQGPHGTREDFMKEKLKEAKGFADQGPGGFDIALGILHGLRTLVYETVRTVYTFPFFLVKELFHTTIYAFKKQEFLFATTATLVSAVAIVPPMMHTVEALWGTWTLMQAGETDKGGKELLSNFFITTHSLFQGFFIFFVTAVVRALFFGSELPTVVDSGKNIIAPQLNILLQYFAFFLPMAIRANRKYAHLWLQLGQAIYKVVASTKSSKLTSILEKSMHA
jgi:hypothetical protein